LARDFDDSSAELQAVDISPTIPTGITEVTLSVWMNPDSITFGQYINDWDTDVGGVNNWAMLLGFQSGNWNLFHDGTYPTGTASDTQMSATAGVWQHVVYQSDSTRLRGFVDGVEQIDVAADLDNNAEVFDLLTFSNTEAGGADYIGLAAHYCVWNAYLNQSELTALANGVSPMQIRQDKILFYCPMWGTDPEVVFGSSAKNMTVTSAPPVVDEPPIGRHVMMPRYSTLLILAAGEALVKIINSTVGLTEASNKVIGFIKNISSTIGLTEATNNALGFVKLVSSTVGITEATNKALGFVKLISSTIGLTEVQNHTLGLIRNISSTIGLTETIVRVQGLVKNITSTVGITEAINQATGFVKVINDTIGITESINKVVTVVLAPKKVNAILHKKSTNATISGDLL